MRGSSDGFSLFEMLVALLVAAFAMSVLTDGLIDRHRTATAADLAKKVAIDAMALGAQSVATGTTRQLNVDVRSRIITIGMVDLVVPQNITLTVKTGAELISQDSKGSILFFADCTSSGGEIALTEPTGATVIVRVNWLTGAVQTRRPQTWR